MKLIPLSPMQREILKFVIGFIKIRGYPPTRQDICDGFGFKSCNAAQQFLKALERKGRVRLASNGVSRGIVVLKSV